MPVSFAAQVGSFGVCPVCDPKPHVGGLIVVAGKRTVRIGGLPAAVVGDLCACVGPPPNKVTAGSGTVRIDGSAACRVGDGTSHGGTVVTGCPVVFIG